MRAYAVRRLLLIIPTLFLTTILIFLVIRLMPGDIVDAMVAELSELGGSEMVDVEVARAFIEQELGLDEPVLTQYGRWLGVIPGEDGSFGGIFQGNLGISLWSKKPVIKPMVQSRLSPRPNPSASSDRNTG